MKMRNIVISVLAVVLVALLCLAILILPMRQLLQQQEASLGIVSSISNESTASELSVVARAHPLAVSLYQHKQHTLIAEDAGSFYSMNGSELYLKFHDAFAPISERSGLHFWDGPLSDCSGQMNGSWMGYDRYTVECGFWQYLNYSLDSSTGQLVDLYYVVPTDMVDFLPESNSDMVVQGAQIADLEPDIASRVLDAYMETVEFPLSEFREVSFGDNMDGNNPPSTTANGYFFSRSMRYSPEYQVFLSTCVEIYNGDSFSLALHAVSLSPREMALLLGLPTETTPLPEAQPLTFRPYTVAKMTQLNSNYFATDSGIYMMQSKPFYNYELLTYFDRETATSRVLCDVPDCGHSNADCPARFRIGDTLYLFVHEDGLYRLYVTTDPETDIRLLTLVRRNLDGTQPQVIWQESPDMERLFLDGYDYNGYLDGENLYLHWSQYDYSGSINCMRRLNLDTMDSQQYSYRQSGRYVSFYNCSSDSFVAQITNESYSQNYIQLFDTELNPIGEGLDITEREGYYQYRIEGDFCYLLASGQQVDGSFSDEPPVLSIYTLEDGSYRPVLEEVLSNESNISYLNGTADLVTLHRYDNAAMLAVVGKDGSLTYNSLTDWMDGVEQYVSPVARCGEEYLVSLNQGVYNNFYLSPFGTVVYSRSYDYQYAFISAEDYLASRPNYRIVQDVQ